MRVAEKGGDYEQIGDIWEEKLEKDENRFLRFSTLQTKTLIPQKTPKSSPESRINILKSLKRFKKVQKMEKFPNLRRFKRQKIRKKLKRMKVGG